MVKRRMYHEIKRLQKQGYGKNHIKRELGIDKKTVLKYWAMGEDEYQRYQEAMQYREKEYDSLRESIIELYRKNEFMRLPVSAVYDYFEELLGELPANENSLRNYIRYLERTGYLVFSEQQRYYIKVSDMPYGKQLQLDFGVRKNKRGGKYYIFGAVLSASRFKYAALQEKPFTTADLIEHLLDCFEYLRGMPEELVIDQDSVMVVEENAGDITYTKAFGDFVSEMGLRMWVCRKADPESKGKIENVIKYIKRNFFAVREFRNLTEARESLMRWLERRANGKISQATKKIPGIEIEEERKYLRQLKNSIYRKGHASAREERIVSDKSRITVDSCQYDLPCKYRNRVVEIYKAGDRLFVFEPHSGEEIAEYTISLLPGQIVKNKAVARETGVKVRELKNEVLGYFVLENWKVFLEANFSAFNRYVRDQCLEARKYFRNQEVDLETLDEALRFCIDNSMLSISNLNDGYRHFLAERSALAGQEPAVSNIMIQNGAVRIIPEMEVSKPDPEPYRSLLSVAGGER
jgi:transposase